MNLVCTYTMDTILTIFILGLTAHLATSSPGGAPIKACANLYPKHGGVDAQITSPPYEIQLSKSEYNPGDTVEVSLKSKDPDRPFKGFIVVATRVKGDTEELVGSFNNIPDTAQGRSWYSQENDWQNCVTHTNNNAKTEVKLTWQSPSDTVGDVVFRGSFVSNAKLFWVEVKSDELKANVSPPDIPCDSCISTDFERLNTSDCGVTKGCMLFPRYCKGDDCLYVITYKPGPQGVMFEMKGKTNGYLTFAISKDKYMGDDDSITCIAKDEIIDVYHGFNPAYFNDRHRITGFRDIQITSEDGVLSCRWTHPYIVNLTHIDQSSDPPGKIPKTFDLNEAWHLFLAYGKVYAGAPVLGKHAEHPLITTGMVNFKDNNIVFADSLPLLIKIHGFLMILAWMLLANLGVVTARHFKNVFGRSCGGVKAWFQVHRLFMILVAILTVAGFVIIFVKVRGWSTKNSVHSIAGCVLTGLMLLQILAGTLRPGPDAGARPYFNILHATFGILLPILAAVTIFFSFQQPYLMEDLKWLQIYIFIAWIGGNFLLLAIIVPLVHICVSTAGLKQSYQLKGVHTINGGNKVEDMNIQEPCSHDMPTQNNAPMGFIYFLFCLVNVGGAVASLTFFFTF